MDERQIDGWLYIDGGRKGVLRREKGNTIGRNEKQGRLRRQAEGWQEWVMYARLHKRRTEGLTVRRV